jgi:hypothetical protein
MSVQTTEAPAVRRPVPFRLWAVFGLSVVLLAGMFVAVYRLSGGSKATPAGQEQSAGDISRIYSSQLVTGTGPGLTAVAAQSRPVALPAVTGTGPGLVQVATESRLAEVPAITGTGPGLVLIADQFRSESVPAITGTGPDLIVVASTRR